MSPDEEPSRLARIKVWASTLLTVAVIVVLGVLLVAGVVTGAKDMTP